MGKKERARDVEEKKGKEKGVEGKVCFIGFWGDRRP